MKDHTKRQYTRGGEKIKPRISGGEAGLDYIPIIGICCDGYNRAGSTYFQHSEMSNPAHDERAKKMSKTALDWMFRIKGLKPTEKIVLFHLAMHHDAKTGRSEINKQLLASKCVISRTTLNTYLASLEGKGIISPLGSSGRGTTAYKINTPSD